MFTGPYTLWGSFCPLKHKTNPGSFAHMLYAMSKLIDELNLINTTLLKSGLPKDKIFNIIVNKYIQFTAKTKFSHKKVPFIY